MSDSVVDPIAWRLDHITRVLTDHDLLLNMLVELCTSPDQPLLGMPLSVVLTSGDWIYGHIAPVEHAAQTLEDLWIQAIRRASFGDNIESAAAEGIRTAMLEGWSRIKPFTSAVERRRDAHKRAFEYLDERFDEADDFDVDKIEKHAAKDVLTFLDATAYLNLQNATVGRPGSERIELSFVRVSLAQVAAWWVPEISSDPDD